MYLVTQNPEKGIKYRGTRIEDDREPQHWMLRSKPELSKRAAISSALFLFSNTVFCRKQKYFLLFRIVLINGIKYYFMIVYA